MHLVPFIAVVIAKSDTCVQVRVSSRANDERQFYRFKFYDVGIIRDQEIKASLQCVDINTDLAHTLGQL